jgi:predicted metal-dependent phosphoesterase TrpH
VVKRFRWVAGFLLFVSLASGTISDTTRPSLELTLDGYQVLAADFHIHTFPLSWGVLSPWDTVIEARRQGLDVIAMTPHNLTGLAKIARWFSRSFGGPIVLVGEEIHSIGYHLLAIGVTNRIAWRQPSRTALDEVHRQGGVAIAAHPVGPYTAYDAEAMLKLDGAEVVHPIGVRDETTAVQLRDFYFRRKLTAVGDSDYHFGPMSPNLDQMGVCRTFVFVRERTEKGILDALREGRTVVYDRSHVYGDPRLIQLAAEDGRLPKFALTAPEPRVSVRLAGILGALGLVIWIATWKSAWD